MNLDTSRLNKLKRIGDGYQAQCPACASEGMDKTGNHLRIFPDGRFGCAVNIGSHEHRSRIWELCGNKSPMPTRIPIRKPRPESDYVNCTALLEEWAMFTDNDGLKTLADKLGVAVLALRCLGVVWSGEHFAFPMRDEYDSVCGIQLRYQEGFKQTLRGSRVGYFLPEMPAQRVAYVTEGASDCAAVLSMGLYSVGRYNCSQSGHKLGGYLRRKGVRDVVVIADNDNAGISGAEKLIGELNMHCCIYTPPCKDAREFLNMGGTRSLIESSVSSLVWRNA